jgi:hypothetical protein
VTWRGALLHEARGVRAQFRWGSARFEWIAVLNWDLTPRSSARAGGRRRLLCRRARYYLAAARAAVGAVLPGHIAVDQYDVDACRRPRRVLVGG